MVNKKNIKSGFTLAEILLVLGIVAFLSLISITLIKSMPDHNKLIFKESYYDANRIIKELINDEDFYPKFYNTFEDPLANGNVYNEASQGFGNGRTAYLNGIAVSDKEKFCTLFASKFITKTTVNCTENLFEDGIASTGNFTTVDNVIWSMNISLFEDPVHVSIDANGTKGPNCYYNDEICKHPDRFSIVVNRNGYIQLPTFENSIIRDNQIR